MPRKPSNELLQLRAFCTVLIDAQIPPGSPELGIFKQMKAAVQQCNQIAGVRQVVGDLIEATQDLSGPQLTALDARLHASGLPTLTFMRSAQNRQLASILSRGRIRTDNEYYLVTSRLADTSDLSWDADGGAQRDLANAIVTQYEEDKGRHE